MEKATSRVEKILTDNGAKITNVDNWGKRKLAYTIKKHDQAVYVFYAAEIPGANVQKIESVLNITDEVIRFLVVRPDLKKIAKAEALLEVESDPVKFGLNKTTEALKAAMVATLPKVRTATKKHILACHAVEILKAKHLALVHKKDSIGGLTYLQNQGYHATPQLPPVKRKRDARP
jgi:small subunit ribosomal protein S6